MGSPSVTPGREVVVWVAPNKRPEAIEAQRREAELAEVKAAELTARKAKAERVVRQCELAATAEKLVLTQLQKLLRLAESPDYAESPGPVDVKDLIKLADLATREYRLDTGKATANIAHAVAPSMDFSLLTQEERDEWRRMMGKASRPAGGGGGS